MSTALVGPETKYGFTPEQVNVIKATIAPGASNDELALFMMVCQKTGLDPFSRQIYLSERRSFDKDTQQWTVKKTPETTIDGFRVIAERSREYEGQEGPYWCGKDGVWKDVWLSREEMPSAAKVGVLRSGFRGPVWGVALFEEYVQTKKDGSPNTMWAKMGANQLAKCAESLALRKAFPRDLSGMYTSEEMEQSRKSSEKEDAQASLGAQKEVAERRIAELSPSPTEIDPDYQARHQALILEANAVLDEVKKEAEAKPKPKKVGTISFEALKAWGELKKELRQLTGTDALYYSGLAAKGYDHANQIATKKDALDIWKVLSTERVRLKGEAELKCVLAEAQRRLGDRFYDIVGAHGAESIDDVLKFGGDSLQTLLAELKTAVDDLKIP